jgi:hypothetical protein
MPVEKRRNTVAVKKAATWGTSETVLSTNTGLYAQSMSNFFLERPEIPDQGAGYGLETNSESGNDTPPAITWVNWPYEDDYNSLMFLAAIMGADTVTGAGDPYTHTMTAGEVGEIFFTWAWETGTEIKAIPSATINSLEIAPSGDGIYEWNCGGTANTVSLAGWTNLNPVTWKSQTGVWLFKNTTLRMNAQAGAGLASPTDDIAVTDLSIKFERPGDEVIVTGGSNIEQPVEGPFPPFMVEFTIPHKNAAGVTLWTAWEAQTLQKMDIVITGSSGDRSLTFQFPQIKLESVTDPFDEIIPVNVVCRQQVASAPPTGMSVTAPTAIWLTDVDSSPIA